MTVSEKAKEKLDEAGKEIKEAIDNLRQEVAELTKKVKEKLKGSGEEMRKSAEELTQEAKGLSGKIRELIPERKKKGDLSIRVEKYPEFRPEIWEQPFQKLRRATDRLFDEFSRNLRWPVAEWQSPWRMTTGVAGIEWPRVDMRENNDELIITAELPGVNKDNLDVSLSQNRVTISGEKKEQEGEKGRGYYRLERSYGSFQRSLPLPFEVESEKVDASFKDGILTVKLPKTAAARERIKKIPVRSG